MFEKEVYVDRRAELLSLMKGQKGIAVFIGNADAPAQYRNNCYKWRQDSTWLYYFGIDVQRLAAVIDLETGEETLYGDDVTLDDTIWTGPMPSVQSLAESAGISSSAPYSKLDWAVTRAIVSGRQVHTIPPSRYFTKMRLEGLGVDKPSEALIKAVISMRIVKTPREIELMDQACDLGVEMHSIGRRGIRIGEKEQEIVGRMEGFALSKGWGVSFSTILTQHGEVFHCCPGQTPIASGKLVLIDAGVENNEHYPSDFTRTYPSTGKFSSKQRDIYQIVYDCNELAFSMAAPGVAYRDVHLAVEAKMLEGLKAVGLVRGDVPTMVEEGIGGLFLPHGLGHNIGLDVHDMEDLGEDLVGYDDDQKRAARLGLGSLRMARRLRPGNVMSDEPGIYFIPALIESWKKEGKGREFINYSILEGYYDFGGIRLEDDVLVTENGARRLGHSRLPIAPAEVEEVMAKENF